MFRRFLLLSIFAAPSFGVVDFPEYQALYAKFGYAYNKSSENFLSNGLRADALLGAERMTILDHRFFIAPEYGLAEDWALGFSVTLLNGAATGSDGLADATGMGLTDLHVFIKHRLIESDPEVIAEVDSNISIGSHVANAADALVTDDGSYDFALFLHTNHIYGSTLIGLTPGVTFRSSGYSANASLLIHAGLLFKRGFVRLFIDGKYSFIPTQLTDSSLDNHDTLGAAGSFTRLAGSPSPLTAGIEAGFSPVFPYEIRIEMRQSLYGTLSPNLYEAKATFVIPIDFYTPVQKKRLKEVPF